MGFVRSSHAATPEEPQRKDGQAIRAVVADKYPLVRAGIRSELSKASAAEIVGEAADGKSAVELARSLQPDIVLMGITLPVLNGLEATARITRDLPGSRVLILSRHAGEEYVLSALKKGATGYLLKRATIEELTQAVRHVASGQVYLSREIAAHLFKNLCSNPLPRADSPLDQLTDRQCEILQLIAEGNNTKQIAAILGVSPKTVDFHRNKLMEKLGIRDVAGLVRLAFREKLLDSE
jgi:DNA-binding NarL/FixJ family response regulator